MIRFSHLLLFICIKVYKRNNFYIINRKISKKNNNMSKKNYKPKNYWLIKENAINESKKYSSRAEFCKGS